MDELRNKSTNGAKREFKLFGEDSTINKDKNEEKSRYQEDHDKHTLRFGLDFIKLLLGAKQFTRERYGVVFHVKIILILPISLCYL
jgi:hypothetical protein